MTIYDWFLLSFFGFSSNSKITLQGQKTIKVKHKSSTQCIYKNFLQKYIHTHDRPVARMYQQGGPKTRRRGQKPEGGATFSKYSIGCMQQPVGQTWNEGHRFQMGGPGTTAPPADDAPTHNNNDIIMIFYCGLMVHITDTRAQKVFSCTSAHITETVLAYDQHWEEQSSLSSPQLYRHSQKHRKWITIQ